jgi:hypothetical protein
VEGQRSKEKVDVISSFEKGKKIYPTIS